MVKPARHNRKSFQRQVTSRRSRALPGRGLLSALGSLGALLALGAPSSLARAQSGDAGQWTFLSLFPSTLPGDRDPLDDVEDVGDWQDVVAAPAMFLSGEPSTSDTAPSQGDTAARFRLGLPSPTLTEEGGFATASLSHWSRGRGEASETTASSAFPFPLETGVGVLFESGREPTSLGIGRHADVSTTGFGVGLFGRVGASAENGAWALSGALGLGYAHRVAILSSHARPDLRVERHLIHAWQSLGIGQEWRFQARSAGAKSSAGATSSGWSLGIDWLTLVHRGTLTAVERSRGTASWSFSTSDSPNDAHTQGAASRDALRKRSRALGLLLVGPQVKLGWALD